MNKTNKLILGLSCLSVVVFGAYKGFSYKNPSKYSFEWIKKLTDKDWKTEREIIRKELSNPEYDVSIRDRLWNLLRLFDKVKSDKDWAGIKPRGPAYHREHGYNLYKP